MSPTGLIAAICMNALFSVDLVCGIIRFRCMPAAWEIREGYERQDDNT